MLREFAGSILTNYVFLCHCVVTDESTTKLQAREKEVANLQAANTEATQRLAREEEKRQQTLIQHFEETESLWSQNMELQAMAH